MVVPSSEEVELSSSEVEASSDEEDEPSGDDDGVMVAVSLLGVRVVKSVGVLVVAPTVRMLSVVPVLPVLPVLPVVEVRLLDDDTVSCEHDISKETRRT